MLTQVRDTLKGAVAWFVIVLLILAFALWGVPELRQFTGGAAVTVGEKRYSQQYVQTEFNRAVQSRRFETGGDFTRDQAIASGLHNQVVSQIATTSALDQFAEKHRLAMPREIVREFLQDNETFQNSATGKFDRAVLQSILQRNGISIEEFERRISGELKRNQIINAIASRGPAPKIFAETVLRRQSEQRRIRYLIVTNEMAGRAQEPTPDDLQKYYADHPSVFTSPEYRTFDLLILRNEAFREDAAAPEEELRRIYELNKERQYDQAEKRTLYQITYETEPEALAAAAALRQGKPFENIASERGLTLDAVTFTEAEKREILDPAVADAAFAEGLDEGAVLDPVQSLFGWTLVQIAGITPAQTTTFEEKRDEIEAAYLEQDVRRALLNAIDEIEEERDTGAGLVAAAEAAGFEVETIGPIDRLSFAPGGAIIDAVPGEALGEAFEFDEGDESEALELADRDGYFFVSLREIAPPALRPFDDVRDDVAARWRKDERDRRIAATVVSIRQSIESGEAFDAVASQFDRAPTKLVIDQRFDNEVISPELNEEIFAATPGALVSGAAAIGNAQVVAEIVEIGSTRGRIPNDQVERFEQYLGYQLDQELLGAFLTGVRADADVIINQAKIDSVFSEAL